MYNIVQLNFVLHEHHTQYHTIIIYFIFAGGPLSEH